MKEISGVVTIRLGRYSRFRVEPRLQRRTGIGGTASAQNRVPTIGGSTFKEPTLNIRSESESPLSQAKRGYE